MHAAFRSAVHVCMQFVAPLPRAAAPAAAVCERRLFAVPRRSASIFSAFTRKADVVPPVAATPAPAAAVTEAEAAPAAPSYTIRDAPEVVSATAPARGDAAVRRGWYKLGNIPGHTKKLNALARQVAGKSANEALAQMAFGPSKRSKSLSDAITRACVNADTYHALPRDALMVEAAVTGKHVTSGRVRHHSKGRAGRSHFRTSRVYVTVREMTGEERTSMNKFARKVDPATKARLDPRGY